MRGDTHKITVYVEPQLKRELEQIAKAQGRNVSAVARIALAAYVLRELEKAGTLTSPETA